MSNAYKAALQRFEDAVRAHAFIGAQDVERQEEIQREYEQARRVLVGKLSYRQLAAEARVRLEMT